MNHLPNYLSISNNPNQVINALISEWAPDKVVILVDENTRQSCLPKIQMDDVEILEIKSGEENKTLGTCQDVWRQLTDLKCSRHSLLINLGGGVIGDLGGFVASTYKRGMKFINVPTTLLSQVDASIGGKLGVDFGGLKNHIGLFREPDHVIVSTDFLKTLPDRELRSGFAEMLKHALIADKDQWAYLRALSLEKANWSELIPKSIQIKGRIVREDPLEKGLRKILNFGHTLGHAIETYFLSTSNKLLHGEAIAVGMILESHLSHQLGWLTKEDYIEISSSLGAKYQMVNELPPARTLEETMFQDKKNDSQGINFSLIKGIGACEYNVKVSRDMINASLDAFKEFK